MSTITTINAGDNISNSRTVINTNFSNLNTDKIETSVLDTDTTLAANSDSKVPTQKAVKAYVDAGGNVNASTTGKGIVEEATDAEVAAGTTTGGTGAKLFITPGTQIFRTATVSLSSANITGLYTTPIELVAAPGASKLVVVHSVTYYFTYGGTQYTGGGDVVIRYQGDTVNLVNTGAMDTSVKAAADAIKTMIPASAGVGSVTVQTSGINKAVQVSNLTAAFATGNGTMKVYVCYNILSL